ncbi:MAG: hypothetical protein V4581_18790 [Bacteroidota bacterium]
MEDKDLDTYFKDRSGSFNEVPGDALWANIEANMAPPEPSKGNGGKWLMGIGAMLILGILIWLIIPNKDTIHQVTPVVKETLQSIPSAPAQVQNTGKDSLIKPVEAVQTKTIYITPQPTVSELAVPATEDVIITAPTANKTASQKETPATKGNGLLHGYSLAATADAAKSNVKNIPYAFELDPNKDEMVINVTQTLTRPERDKLVSSTIALNAPYVGRKIVINAKGYRLYRHTITKQDALQYSSSANSLKQPKLKVEVMTDSLLYDIIRTDSLKTETIKFEKKTEPKQ